MSAQPLPTTPSSLQFIDGAGCKRWIDKLTLTNVQLTQQALTTQLASLCAAQLAPLERLKILETLRDPVQFLHAESANRYAGKPLPLDPGDATGRHHVNRLRRD